MNARQRYVIQVAEWIRARLATCRSGVRTATGVHQFFFFSAKSRSISNFKNSRKHQRRKWRIQMGRCDAGTVLVIWVRVFVKERTSIWSTRRPRSRGRCVPPSHGARSPGYTDEGREGRAVDRYRGQKSSDRPVHTGRPWRSREV